MAILRPDRVDSMGLYAIDSTTIVPATFKTLIANGLPRASFLIRIINECNVPIFISYDGVTDNDYLLEWDTLQLPTQSHFEPNNYVCLFKRGQGIYVTTQNFSKGGNIYLCAYY